MAVGVDADLRDHDWAKSLFVEVLSGPGQDPAERGRDPAPSHAHANQRSLVCDQARAASGQVQAARDGRLSARGVAVLEVRDAKE